MMISLRNNMMVDRAVHNLNLNMDTYSKSVFRLSSGLRINSFADDPAGAVIASQFESDIISLRQQSKNNESEISLLQTKEGALNSMQDTLGRMEQLASQAATGSYSQAQRNIMNNEFQQLKEEYAWIANSTEFNGNPLFSQIDLGPVEPGEENINNPFADISLNDIDLANEAIKSLKNLVEEKSSERSSVGSSINIAESRIRQLDMQAENLSEAKSRITDVDVAQEMVELTKSQVLVEASISVIKTANEMSEMVLRLLD